MYSPKKTFITPVELLIPTYKYVKGVNIKIYPENGELIYCSFSTFGGTEKIVNDILSVENTAVIECWYRPDIKSDCVIKYDGTLYEIIGSSENIENRNQYIRIKIKAVKAGA